MKLKNATPKSISDLPEICSMGDVIEILPLSRSTAYRLAKQGTLPSFRVGHRVMISRERLKVWIEQEMQSITCIRAKE